MLRGVGVEREREREREREWRTKFGGRIRDLWCRIMDIATLH